MCSIGVCCNFLGEMYSRGKSKVPPFFSPVGTSELHHYFYVGIYLFFYAVDFQCIWKYMGNIRKHTGNIIQYGKSMKICGTDMGNMCEIYMGKV